LKTKEQPATNLAYVAFVARSLIDGQKRGFGCGQFAAIIATREQVAIGVHRHDDGGMAEPFLHYLGR
jgi:hypothetical protein